MVNFVSDVQVSSVLGKTIIIESFETVTRRGERDETIMSIKLNSTGERLKVHTTSCNLAKKLAKVTGFPVITSIMPSRYGLHFTTMTGFAPFER